MHKPWSRILVFVAAVALSVSGLVVAAPDAQAYPCVKASQAGYTYVIPTENAKPAVTPKAGITSCWDWLKRYFGIAVPQTASPQPQKPPASGDNSSSQQPSQGAPSQPSQKPAEQPTQPAGQQPAQQPSGQPSSGQAPSSGASRPSTCKEPQDLPGLADQEQAMLALVNQARAENGLRPLQLDQRLVKLARMKSHDIVQNRYFSHTSPTYGSPFTMMRNYCVSFRTAGENLAEHRDYRYAHYMLMQSPGHRANILNPNFTHIGIGIVRNGNYGVVVTQMFVGR